ncbi:hypothetical protein LL912_12415 [Niabella sp. CC-SYL272]|uniref:hypothetical protein n=1 Tax=Niabella agricola TaxID=2891571 RepID=UPI001F201DBE|nr:hypothetical protein [Niabella agricola]MCF3109576.1 hypothetical protein [Niabella agricola]
MRTILIVAIAISVAVSCTDDPKVQITGAYAREFTFKQNVLSTGEELGTATIRDTIFIRAKEQGYEISNHKWRKNDYD